MPDPITNVKRTDASTIGNAALILPMLHSWSDRIRFTLEPPLNSNSESLCYYRLLKQFIPGINGVGFIHVTRLPLGGQLKMEHSYRID